MLNKTIKLNIIQLHTNKNRLINRNTKLKTFENNPSEKTDK